MRGPRDSKGYMTIEASFIVPIILFGCYFIIMGLMLVYERGYIISREYEEIFELPLYVVRDETVGEHLSDQTYDAGVVVGAAEVSGSYSSHRATCTGVLHIYGETGIDATREIDICSDRLRRWQLYDDIAEK